MAVALDEAAVQKLGPSAQKQIATSGGAPKETPAVTPRTKTETKTLPQPSSGPSQRTRTAARQTRMVATKIGPRGSVRSTMGGHPTVRGFIWLFVWLGVLFYLMAHPTTLPRLVSLIFAPIDGVLAVANGTAHTAKKVAT